MPVYEEGEGIVTKLAFIDLDGVVADSTARFAEATATAEKAFVDKAYVKQEWDHIYWRTAFSSDLVSLDTLIAHATDHIEVLKERGYQVILLTSRPDTMRTATVQWCIDHGVQVPYSHLVMKPSSAQFTKTVTWKASTVQVLAPLFEAETALLVDDEQATVEEVQKHCGSAVRCYSSLAEAVAKEVQAQ